MSPGAPTAPTGAAAAQGVTLIDSNIRPMINCLSFVFPQVTVLRRPDPEATVLPEQEDSQDVEERGVRTQSPRRKTKRHYPRSPRPASSTVALVSPLGVELRPRDRRLDLSLRAGEELSRQFFFSCLLFFLVRNLGPTAGRRGGVARVVAIISIKTGISRPVTKFLHAIAVVSFLRLSFP